MDWIDMFKDYSSSIEILDIISLYIIFIKNIHICLPRIIISHLKPFNCVQTNYYNQIEIFTWNNSVISIREEYLSIKWVQNLFRKKSTQKYTYRYAMHAIP